MELLSLRDKLEIFDLRSVSRDFVSWRGRKAYVFEYLSLSDRAVMAPVMRRKNLGYQVVIVKEDAGKVIGELAGKEWVDFSRAVEKSKDGFSITINDRNRDEFGFRAITEDELAAYSEDGYFYRHYLILDVEDGDGTDVEAETYGMLMEIRDSGVPIRKLSGNDLLAYLGKSFLAEDSGKDQDTDGTADPFGVESLDEGAVKKFGKALQGVNDFAWGKIGSAMRTAERMAFHQSAAGVTNEAAMLLSWRMWKGKDFFRVGDEYRGGVVVKWLPKDDFNVLRNLYRFMQPGDSVVINLYPWERHVPKRPESGGKGITAVLAETAGPEDPGKTYLQMVVWLKEISPYLLERRIQSFQRGIGFDFFAQRIVGTMSRYAETVSWTGRNRLNLERAYDSSRLSGNLLF